MSQWKSDKLYFASISDIHLGHPRTPTWEIIERLKKAFPDDADTAKLDLIILAGDIFDKLLFFPDEAVFDIVEWIAGFLRVCKKHNVIVRIVEGTPSHDRGQAKHFIHVNEEHKINCDVKYVDKLSVELCEPLGLSILYIPDDWDTDFDRTWEQAQKAVYEQGLKQVDLAITHSFFDYQVPEHLNFAHHKSERYLELVKGFILNGHVHTPTQNVRILAAGSFDRTAHNEEHDKGHWRITTNRDFDDFELVFRVNHGASPYVTVDCVGLSFAEAKKKVDAVLEELSEKTEGFKYRTNVRIHAERGAEIFAAFDDYRKLHNNIRWTTKVETEKLVVADKESVVGEKYQSVQIHENNIEHLVDSALVNSGSDPLLTDRVKSLLKTII